MKSKLTSALTALGVSQPLAAARGHDWSPGRGATLTVHCPIDGSPLASFGSATESDVQMAVASANTAFQEWRTVPAPKRGEIVRLIGEKLRRHKTDLALLVTLESGKILDESLGEVQEMIDVCDFAVGLSRQLYGLNIASERPGHRLAEQWHPLGPVGVITAFNFPVAVWAWNAMIALVCGDTLVWKPSEKTPLCAMACHAIVTGVLAGFPRIPAGIVNLVVGRGADVGKSIAAAPELPLVSATGSVPMGRSVAQTVAARLGRTLLELGGNNGAIIAPSADLELALRAITFAAVGTCGQRCTTLRRLIVHRSVADSVLFRLLEIYKDLPIGNPLQSGTLVGPLIDETAARQMTMAIEAAGAQGGRVHGGSRITDGVPAGGAYVRPAIVEIEATAPIIQTETFRANSVFHALRHARSGDRNPQRRAARPGFGNFHQRRARGRAVLLPARIGLWNRECEHRHQRSGDWRCFWRRKGNRRRPGIGFRRLEAVHAACHEYDQLFV